MLKGQFNRSYENLSNLKYGIWRLDELLRSAVQIRDKRCCRCNAAVSLRNARIARITNPNNLENRFNLDLVALCCPKCEEYCAVMTEYALVSISQRSKDFFRSVKRQQLWFEELTKEKLVEYHKKLTEQIKQEKSYQKKVLEECKEAMR